MTDDPLLYRQLAAEHDLDVPGGVPALAGLDDPIAALDAQSIAYRSIGPGDVVLDGEIPGMAERIHPPYLPGQDVRPATVEEYEAAGWDEGRADPRP